MNSTSSAPSPAEPRPSHVSSIRIRIHCGELYAMGPGKADLLEAVEACRSIAGAGRALGYSYSKTRRLIDEMNFCFRSPVVETMKGGSERGGARVTETGRRALTVFRAMEAKAKAAIQADLGILGALLVEDTAVPGTPCHPLQVR